MYTELIRASIEYAKEVNDRLEEEGIIWERVPIWMTEDEAFHTAKALIDSIGKKHPEVLLVLDKIERDLAWKEYNDGK